MNSNSSSTKTPTSDVVLDRRSGNRQHVDIKVGDPFRGTALEHVYGAQIAGYVALASGKAGADPSDRVTISSEQNPTQR